MAIAKDLTALGRLVAARNGWGAAKAFKSYVLTEADGAVIGARALELLRLMPPVARPAPLLAAALAVDLESRLDAPIEVVAGTLCVEGAPVLGDRRPFEGAKVFAGPEPAFDGHVWIMLGGHIVDPALFRIATSRDGPPALARHVDLVFGPGKALYVDAWKRTARHGLAYEPEYVLSREEVTRVMGGAFHAIKAARPSPSA